MIRGRIINVHESKEAKTIDEFSELIPAEQITLIPSIASMLRRVSIEQPVSYSLANNKDLSLIKK